jgi:hypothetical protein
MPTFLRSATWLEVEALFHGADGVQQALKNAAGWASRYGLDPYQPHVGVLSLECWTSEELRDAMEIMSRFEPRVTVDLVNGTNNAVLPPRLDGLPPVFVRFGEKLGILDGKHRVNRWKDGVGPWAVLVIQC